MKKTVSLLFTTLSIFFLHTKTVHAKKIGLNDATIAGEILVFGMDPFGAPFTNGQTNVSMEDGTLFMNTATGSSISSVFTIENINFIDELTISNITITGANASDFNIEGIPPTQVNPGSNELLIINFAPQTAGTKNATVTITSNDATNSTFTFAIQGTALEGATGLHFDGIDDYITFPNGNYNLGPEFTLELWIKPEISGPTEHFILDTRNGISGHGLFIDFTSKLNFIFFTSSGINFLSSTSTITDQWQHIAITYDGVNYKMYINGVEDASLPSTEIVIDNADNLRLGDTADGGLPYAGAMDELRIWNTPFSSCRISDQSQCELTGNETDLEAYYNFNSGEVNGNNFPIYSILDPNHTISAGIPPQGFLTNFGLTGTTSNWIDSTANGVSGTCNAYSESIIRITSNSNAINNGDTSVNINNNTSFGNVEFGQAEPADYTISNTGTATLNISNIIIDGASDFTIIESPNAVTAGASGNLRILFTPSSIGTKIATVRILNDDCDDATFEFVIEGTGFIPATGISLDGTDDHISINHNSLFNTNTFTIEAYFKTTSTAGGQAIISKYDTTGINGFSLFLNSSGRIRFEYAVSNIESTISSSASGFNDGNWHHIALAFGDGKAIYYIDGVLDNEITFNNIPDAPTNTESLYIGYSAFNNVHFNGDVDEVRYWSRTLCSDEILAQQSCELVGNESGLVAYYKLNEGNIDANNATETTAADATSNSLDGTLMNFALTGSTSNWTDTSVNGISGNCSIAIPEINVQGNGNDILNGDTSPETVDNTDAGSINVGNSAEMNFFVRNTDGTGTLNIEGVILTGDTADFTITQNPHNNPLPATESASLTIEFTPTSGGTKTATVIIDSDDCDEPSYSFTIKGTGVPPGTGLDFDGTDDIVTIPHNASQNNLNFSVDFWIKTTDGLGGVINKFTPDGNNGWRINLDGGRIEFYHYASATNYITRLLSPETSVNDGDWHHVAVTLDSGSARCYIDGVLARSTGWNGTATATTTTADIQIGYAAADTPSGDTGGYFDGELDELRIWTKTLTAYEVSQLNGCTTDMSQTDLAASYNFNEGIAAADNSGLTTLADGSGNNYNGTLTNFALTGTTSNWIDASTNNVSGSCDCVVLGGVTLTNQTEVDNYTAGLGTCGIIEGNITINGTITDVSGFSNIHTISGNLQLEGNIVNDLSGFNTLTTIGEDFILKDMINTTNISAFSNVTSLGGNFEVDNLDQLNEISIFNDLTTISRITISNNATLANIDFDQLQNIDSNLTVIFNSSLGTISLPNLKEVSNEFRMNNNGSVMTGLQLPLLENTGSFRVADMNGLQSIQAPELLTTSSNLSINGCSVLTTLTFPKLTSIGSDLGIDNCILLDTITTTSLVSIGEDVILDELSIASLDFLQNVTSITSLSLRDLTVLSNLQGLNALTNISRLNITNCDLVPNLEGFPNLNITFLSSLNISSNSGITTLSNSFIESLTSLESFSITFNENLIEIDALQNVASLTDDEVTSVIRDNNSLQNINLYALQNVVKTLEIRNQINTTNLCGLYDYVTLGNGATTISFAGTNPTNWDSVQDILNNCGSTLNISVYIQGASLNPNTGEESLMRDDLRIAGLIPTTSPYTDALTCDSSIFTTTGTDAIVDWVWVELRDGNNRETVISGQSALLQRDGDVTGVDGASALSFPFPSTNYHIKVNHRNHLGITTANPIALNATTSIDFTADSANINGGNVAVTSLANGNLALFAGDGNGDGSILNTDIMNALQASGVSGYLDNDANMDSFILNNDIQLLIQPNAGKIEQE